ARAAAADRTGNAAVPHDLDRLRPAHRDPADRGAVRAGLPGPAPDPQVGAQHAVLAGVRRAPGRSLAPGLARGQGGAPDPGGDGVAGAGVLRQQVRAGTAAAARLTAVAATRARPGNADRREWRPPAPVAHHALPRRIQPP